MHIKAIAISLALAQAVSSVHAAAAAKPASNSSSTSTAFNSKDYWKSFTSPVNPLNISLPSLPQTTSHDPTQECVDYPTPTEFKFVASEWPSIWETATSNGMNTSAEFKQLYNSINWSKMPNIPVRKLGPNGAPDMTGYDNAKDPDCWWSATTCTIPKNPGVNADIYACAEPDTWGLTYDDGPNCSHNAFYDYLEQQKLKATMFYIGSNVIDWPYGAQRGIKDGHHIADHTWSHQLMTTLTNEEVLAEFYYTQKAIKLTTGITPLYWRPAFGDVDDRVRWIATQLGLTTVLWNLDTDDWAAGNSEPVSKIDQNYQDFVSMGSNGTFSKGGNIVLTHEINNTTMQLALDYLPKIQQAYKHVVDIATCMNITYPYQEKIIAFKSFADAVASGITGGLPSASVSGGAPSASGNAAASGTPGSNSGSSDSSSPAKADAQTKAPNSGMTLAPTTAVAAASLAVLALFI
ncbi:hypothetical protein DFQ28_002496 [Apophysomyces sp. BC1034]|nr:hypothetical protein DFQ30_001241 [Apophysomyces sp. BC1015]KAG0178481.1 hypothetical protein DFQ29_003420 [Apophysomyces sp. BC1021]KAG0190084.1 hypothetical protein DFQ28_002496 [Apophysomyces sp. BC1034]